jgi:hypothetical protein
MGSQLIATSDTANERDRALSFANWLRVACVKCGPVVGDRCFSQLDTGWAAVTPDARVI